jgi:hypothetical protein
MRENEVSTGDVGCCVVFMAIVALTLIVACVCETIDRVSKLRTACPCQQQTEES